ncbi:pyrroline-5-carboxylate reductase [Phocaeicola sp.]
MKVAIIGAGNMGGAIARGLAQGTVIPASDVTVADPFSGILETLKSDYPEINITTDNPEAIKEADIVILAVKPWLVDQVLSVIRLTPQQVLVSVAAGVSFEQLVQSVGPELTLFRLVPNTAISQMESMTLISSRNASKEQEQLMLDVFNEMGTAMMIPESQIPATTALTSCGIAYVLKYIQAAMQAGIEMGVYPKEAQKMVAQSVKGAAALILNNDTHPSVEIDKVTTPGGITIKGINELDHEGFTSAIIKAMKASCVK